MDLNPTVGIEELEVEETDSYIRRTLSIRALSPRGVYGRAMVYTRRNSLLTFARPEVKSVELKEEGTLNRYVVVTEIEK